MILQCFFNPSARLTDRRHSLSSQNIFQSHPDLFRYIDGLNGYKTSCKEHDLFLQLLPPLPQSLGGQPLSICFTAGRFRPSNLLSSTYSLLIPLIKPSPPRKLDAITPRKGLSNSKVKPFSTNSLYLLYPNLYVHQNTQVSTPWSAIPALSPVLCNKDSSTTQGGTRGLP